MWNSPYINHFISADTIIPGYTNPQSLNRYAYVLNNPIKLIDPTGHKCVGKDEECEGENGKSGHGFGVKAPKPKKRGTGSCSGAGCQGKKKSQPWTFSHNVNIGLQLGPVEEFFAPEYSSDDYNGLPHSLGITHSNDNFFLTFQVTYNQTSGIHISEMQYSNQYDGLAKIESIRVNQQEIYSGDSYLPTPGTGVYNPIAGTGGNYNGNDPVTIELTVSYETNTGNGNYLQPVTTPMVLPSLQNLRDFIETGQVSNSIYIP